MTAQTAPTTRANTFVPPPSPCLQAPPPALHGEAATKGAHSARGPCVPDPQTCAQHQQRRLEGLVSRPNIFMGPQQQETTLPAVSVGRFRVLIVHYYYCYCAILCSSRVVAFRACPTQIDPDAAGSLAASSVTPPCSISLSAPRPGGPAHPPPRSPAATSHRWWCRPSTVLFASRRRSNHRSPRS